MFTFIRMNVTLYDQISGKMIGIRYESHDFYYLSTSPFVCAFTVSPMMIHAQLDHLELTKLQNTVPGLEHLFGLNCDNVHEYVSDQFQ